MVRKCIVRGCKSEWSPGCMLKFHTYPASIARRNEWLAKVPIKSKMYKDAKICSLHFKLEDYDQSGKRLTQSATPFYSEEHDGTFPKVEQETPRKEHKMLGRLLKDPPHQACTSTDSDSDCDITELKHKQRKKRCKVDTDQNIQPELQNNEKDTTLDLMLSVGRNIRGNPLVITLEPTLAQNEKSPSEHNYASKNFMETEYVEIEPEDIHGDMSDEKAGNKTNEVDPINEEGDETSQCSEPRSPSSCSEPAYNTIQSPDSLHDATDDSYKQKYIYEHYQNKKLIEKTEKQQTKIQELQRKVKILQMQLKRRQVKEKKFNEIRRVLRQYTRFSEIDNILQGRFMKLCSIFCKNDKPITFTDDAKKFAVSLYYISPECYNLVKKYIQLPNTKILKKFLSSNSVVINLNDIKNE